MSDENLKHRTKRFALDVVKLDESLPDGKTTNVWGRQLLRSGTFVGANYRATCRANSPADFIFKLGIVEEEADESSFWIELLVEAGKLNGNQAANRLRECNELVAITVASIQTVRKNRGATPHPALRIPH